MDLFDNRITDTHYYKTDQEITEQATGDNKETIEKQKDTTLEKNILTILQEKEKKKNDIDIRPKEEFSATNEPVKVKKEKEIAESEFLWKRFDKQENNYKGKTSLDLSESE
ncbi:TPA: hypothetical protein DIC40_04965 [Patescibacteria group bacterium]|nr:hypothetical protein [Candidatus Gracilibacteria bacterium]